MRYFKATLQLEATLREQVQATLGQPNGRADRPWPIGGNFQIGGEAYIALAPHQSEGEFWQPLISGAIAAGAVEITQQDYDAARPDGEI